MTFLNAMVKLHKLKCIDSWSAGCASVSQPNAATDLPDRITWPGTIHQSGTSERQSSGVRGRRVWHGLLVAMSCTACLSRFTLIKDKSSLMGCRCATLMSITPLKHTHTRTHKLIHICYSMLCSISSSLPLPPLCLSHHYIRGSSIFPVLIQQPLADWIPPMCPKKNHPNRSQHHHYHHGHSRQDKTKALRKKNKIK